MNHSLKNQENPIKKIHGPSVILAGAGTGKTQAILEKTKHLIRNNHAEPNKIVLITFSNEAANSLQTRIARFLPQNSKQPIIKTFHAFSADLLREHKNKNFTILTPDEAKVVLHRNLKVPAGNCHKYVGSIGTAKDLGITISKIESFLNKKLAPHKDTNLEKHLENLQFEYQTLYLNSNKKDKHLLSAKIKEISDIIRLQKFIKAWKAYEKLKEIKNYQDYSDLNTTALALLKEKPEIASDYEYIIVDEFQDTNKIQLDLLKSLAVKKNITVVGDMNQSIYRFRGAYNKNLDEFKNYYHITDKEIFNLDKSYRSSNKILNTAFRLILNNYQNQKEQFEVKNANNREGKNISVFELKNSKEEARKVSELVQQHIEHGETPEEICIMFRNHNYGRVLKRALEFKNIKYTSITRPSLLEQKSIRTIVSYLIILNKLKNHSSGGEQDWWELLYNSHLQEEDLIKIGRLLKDNKNAKNISANLLNHLTSSGLSNDGNQKAKILIERLKLMLPSLQKPLKDFVKSVFHFSGLTKKESGKEILLNLNRFYDLVCNHISLYEPDLSSFLNYLDTLKDLKIEIQSPEVEESGVRLMTLHSTKGLEYNTVIITNLVQKRFPMEKYTNNSLIPSELSPDFSDNNSNQNLGEQNTKQENKDTTFEAYEQEKKNQMSEERRLCYVAFTRAKNNLILTYAKKYGTKDFYPSQFLNEINYKQNKNVDFFKDNEEKYEEPELEISPAPNFATILNKQNFEENLKQIVNKPREQKEIIFSPSSLLLFSECQKKYEYKYVYNMPEKKTGNWEAIRLGSFVHKVLEEGVKNSLSSEKEFLDLAKEIKLKPDWESVELEQAGHLIKVFYARNKDKFDKNSKTEQRLSAEIDGIKFVGFADRIDVKPSGLEVIDYKTGASVIPTKNRNWQLGFYALAVQQQNKVRKITLDMLKHEKPLEFTLDEEGNAKSEYGRMEFNLQEVKESLVIEAKKVLEAYKFGFKPCPLEKNCEFCEDYFYNNH